MRRKINFAGEAMLALHQNHPIANNFPYKIINEITNKVEWPVDDLTSLAVSLIKRGR